MNATSSKYKLFKAVGIILAFIILVSVLKALFFISFFFFIFVLIFRSAIKHKEKTGSWPIKFVPYCPYSAYRPPFDTFRDPSPRIGSKEWDMNPLNHGSMAWHGHHASDRNT